MAAGTPVIVARTGGLAEIVRHEGNGLCFTPGDVAELRHCLIRVLQNPDWAGAMSRRARDLVATAYTWEAVARRTGKVYRDELSNRK
jgi:glycosyltransferase involved in cell wall biosynthesis